MADSERDRQVWGALDGLPRDRMGEDADVGLTAARILRLLQETENGKLPYRVLLRKCVERGWLLDESEMSKAALSEMLREIPTVKSKGGWVVLRPYGIGTSQAVRGHDFGAVDMDKVAYGLRLLLEAVGYRVVGAAGVYGEPARGSREMLGNCRAEGIRRGHGIR